MRVRVSMNEREAEECSSLRNCAGIGLGLGSEPGLGVAYGNSRNCAIGAAYGVGLIRMSV